MTQPFSKKALHDIAVELSVVDEKMSLVEAKVSADLTYSSTKSDTAGRRRELTLALADHEEHKKLRARQLSLKTRQAELEAENSIRNFTQRNQMVDAINKLAGAIVLLAGQLKKEDAS